MKEFPPEMIEFIAEGDTIIFNFPLSIFNSAAEWLPGKLKLKSCLSAAFSLSKKFFDKLPANFKLQKSLKFDLY